MTRRRLDGDLVALAGLLLLVVLRFAPDWLRGVTPFWGDLTYLHQPWRAYDAELLAAGRLPWWNPFLYFGMPQAASMQDSLFYPGTAPFFLFGFPVALALFEAVHYWLAGALAYLWLRSWRLARPAAFGGAALFAFSGLMLSREPFLNHLAVLALAPALALFFRRGALLCVTLALSFLGGYPPFLVGGAVSAWALAAAQAPARARAFWAGASRAWLTAGLGAAALAACLLLPAAELVGISRRAAGVGLDEALAYGFSPRDLLHWVSPLLAPGSAPAVEWWKCCYLGFVGLACAAAGLWTLPRRRALALAGAVAAVVALTLGGSNPASAWLWANLPPLRFIRYPGNTAYLAALPLAALAAAGLQRAGARMRRLAVGALCLELAASAWGAMPRAPAALLTSKGPLAARLQAELSGRRYLLSPRALESTSGENAYAWRHRLFGLSNAPLKLRAAANFGEPLVPRANYELMDRLLSAGGAAAVAPALPWLDVGALLTPKAGEPLWASAPIEGAAGARLLSSQEGGALPAAADFPQDRGRPLAVERRREDAFSVRGAGAGWVFVAEPLYPGWSVWLETPRGPGMTRALPALGPFQKAAVPEGPWTLHWRYEPASAARGLALTLAAAGLLASYWYNRARKSDEP